MENPLSISTVNEGEGLSNGMDSPAYPVRECLSAPEPEDGFITRPNICVQSDRISITRDLASEGEFI